MSFVGVKPVYLLLYVIKLSITEATNVWGVNKDFCKILVSFKEFLFDYQNLTITVTKATNLMALEVNVTVKPETENISE